VATRRRVGPGRGRAEPALVIEVGRHRFRSLLAGEPAADGKGAGHADLDLLELADVTVAHALAGHAHLQAGAAPGAALQDALVFGDRPADGASVGDAAAERFFRIQILAGPGRRDGDTGVPVVGRGVHDGVDVGTRQHLAEIVVEVALADFGEGGGAFEVLAVDVAERNHLDAFVGQEGAQVAGALAAEADAGQAHAAVGGGGTGAAEGGGGQDQGQGGLKEAAAAGAGSERHEANTGRVRRFSRRKSGPEQSK